MSKLICLSLLVALSVTTNTNKLKAETFVRYQVHKLSTSHDWESTLSFLGSYMSSNNNDVAIINGSQKTIDTIGSHGEVTLKTYPTLMSTFNQAQQICFNENISYPVLIKGLPSDRDKFSCITLKSNLRGDYMKLEYSFSESNSTDVFGSFSLANGESALIKNASTQGEVILVTPTTIKLNADSNLEGSK